MLVMKSLANRAKRVYSEYGLIITISRFFLYLIKTIPAIGDYIKRRLLPLPIAVEYAIKNNVPVTKCLFIALKGYTPDTYYFLDLGETDREKYIQKIGHVNGNASRVLRDKIATQDILQDVSENLPEIYGTVHYGMYFSRDGKTSSIKEAAEAYSDVIIKPVSMYHGEDVFKISFDENTGLYVINGEEIHNFEKWSKSLQWEDYIVTEYIEQHEYSDKIFSESVNTIRILSIINPKTGQANIVRAAHRFGTSDSAPTDNLNDGGIAAPVDVKAGVVKSPVVLEKGKRKRLDVHPQTGAQVSGIEIPLWDETKSLVAEAAELYPNARVIGWDIVVTDEKPIILEANGTPGTKTLQLEEGLLKEPIVRDLLDQA